MPDLSLAWMTDPAAWAGFATLVVLELVLGVDNLIFIAILADKLPANQRDRARVIGLSLALILRFALLLSITWVMSLTAPVVTVIGNELSWRDLILIGGGMFLLVKATMEIHDRIEAKSSGTKPRGRGSRFWPIVAQIIVIDLVFSLDSVITAIGMVDEVTMMMAAVLVAIIGMMVASRSLTQFINAHPTLVILCLGFLLMIGLVLVVDGLGYHVPKGYVYAAIAFALLIETFNQMRERNRRKVVQAIPARQRIANDVLRLLAGVPLDDHSEEAKAVSVEPTANASNDAAAFGPSERRMVQGVLALAARPVKSIMTPRDDIEWVDSTAPPEAIHASVRVGGHPSVVVCRGTIDDVAGIVHKDALLELYIHGRHADLAAILREPLVVPEQSSILTALNLFKAHPADIALIVDQAGSIEGIVTETDFLRAIAGDIEAQPEGSLATGGAASQQTPGA
ncbi:MAG TPA: CBS domain-containing protein [Casimicrobiaceae bacterium]|nr:CBS domain-containing protein [Casimicrobiaceae bacterium]